MLKWHSPQNDPDNLEIIQMFLLDKTDKKLPGRKVIFELSDLEIGYFQNIVEYLQRLGSPYFVLVN